MKIFKNKAYCFAVLLVLLSLCAEQTEARRKILRGRRTVTRQNYGGLGIPAWVIIVIIALSNLILGAILYFVMRKLILQAPIENVNSYTPAMMDEP